MITRFGFAIECLLTLRSPRSRARIRAPRGHVVTHFGDGAMVRGRGGSATRKMADHAIGRHVPIDFANVPVNHPSTTSALHSAPGAPSAGRPSPKTKDLARAHRATSATRGVRFPLALPIPHSAPPATSVVYHGIGRPRRIPCTPTTSPARRVPTCCNTPTIPWIGIPGGRKRSKKRASKTSRSSFPSAIPLATGATSWSASRSKTKQIADILNRDFVSIKVDREERPDIDRIYMTFVQATTGGGGWPMSVWLTPELQAVFRRHLLPAR